MAWNSTGRHWNHLSSKVDRCAAQYIQRKACPLFSSRWALSTRPRPQPCNTHRCNWCTLRSHHSRTSTTHRRRRYSVAKCARRYSKRARHQLLAVRTILPGSIWLSQSWHQPPQAVVPSPVAPQSSHFSSIALTVARRFLFVKFILEKKKTGRGLDPGRSLYDSLKVTFSLLPASF